MSLVSILIPVYNESRRLPECLGSLQNQTYKSIEILVIDDGSTDQTVQVAQLQEGVRVLERPHEGKAAAINAGALEARGEVLFFLDGDMVFATDYVEKMMEAFEANEAGVTHGQEAVANPENRWAQCLQLSSGLPPEERQGTEVVSQSNVFRGIRKADFLRVGGFEHTGFRDDQTLAPKIGKGAKIVPGARAYHYNPETLGEVFASGKWAGKSAAMEYGPKAIVHYAPPLVLARALHESWKHRRLSMIPYRCLLDLGTWVGTLSYTLGWEKHAGK